MYTHSDECLLEAICNFIFIQDVEYYVCFVNVSPHTHILLFAIKTLPCTTGACSVFETNLNNYGVSIECCLAVKPLHTRAVGAMFL